MDYVDRIKPDSKSIFSYLEDLLRKNYQIPTFQREVVWNEYNVKKLWDSIYKFYPIGSVLIWKTLIKLHNHRDVFGFIISDEDVKRTEYQYILDGQQRTNALLSSLYGGKIEGKDNFNPTLYFDLTVLDNGDNDETNFKKRFLFWSEIDDKNGDVKPNTENKNKFDQGLIIKLKDIKDKFESVEERLVEHPTKQFEAYKNPTRQNLRNIKQVLDNYKISIIELKDIQVSQVCQIFERINQEGKALDVFDIVVAKTYRPKTDTQEAFYLRELIDNYKKTIVSDYKLIDDLTILQMLSVIIMQNLTRTKVFNITEKYLNEIKAEEIEEIWDDAKIAINKTFDFFDNHLRIKGPQLIPYRYFYLSLVTYFYNNKVFNYNFLMKYFWYYSFHNEELLKNTTDLKEHIEILKKHKTEGLSNLGRFLIDKNDLRKSSYSSKGRLSRAILSLYANQEPRDWKLTQRNVISEVYYMLTDKPNLHHIFPSDFIEKNPGSNKLDSNSLMNIAYLTQITNLEISNKNPIQYIKDYDTLDFRNILNTHLLTSEILDWASEEEMPENALDLFIEKRIDNVIEVLKLKIGEDNFEVIDTKEKLK